MRAAHNGIKESWRKSINRDIMLGLEHSDLSLFLKDSQHIVGVVVWDDDESEAHLTLQCDVKGNIFMADVIQDVRALCRDYYDRFFVKYPEDVQRKLKECLF